MINRKGTNEDGTYQYRIRFLKQAKIKMEKYLIMN